MHGVGRSERDGFSDSVNYVRSDITDTQHTIDLFAEVDPDYVVHLAGCSVAKRELEWVEQTFSANLVSTVNVLSAGEKTGVKKTVIAGSLEQPDDGNCAPASPYAASKLAATSYAKMFHAVYGTNVVIARIFMVYGPGQKELQKWSLMSVCLRRAENRRR